MNTNFEKSSAYELADDAKNIHNTIEALEFVQKAVPMLRQQADRIAELEEFVNDCHTVQKMQAEEVYKGNARIAELEKLVEEMKYEKSSGVYDVSSKPVAWINRDEKEGWLNWDKNTNMPINIPLYTHPVKQLSNDRIREIGDELKLQNGGVLNWIDFARAIIKASRGEE